MYLRSLDILKIFTLLLPVIFSTSIHVSAQISDIHLDKDQLFKEGETLVLAEKYKEAAGKFELVASIDPNYKDVYTNLSHMYILLGMFPHAERAAKNELKNYPASSMAYNNWGYALLRQEQYDEAILQLRRAILFGTGNSRAYINLIDAYTITQNLDEAIKLSEETIAKFPMLNEVHRRLIMAHIMRGNFTEALAAARKLKDGNPKDDSGILLEIEVLGFARRFTEMNALVEKALAADPKNVINLEKFAAMYRLARQHTKALDIYKRILVIQPENYNAAFNIGMSYSDLRRYALSNAALEKALNINPRSSQTLMLKAHNYLSLKNKNAARKCYEMLKEFDAESAAIILETIKNH